MVQNILPLTIEKIDQNKLFEIINKNQSLKWKQNIRVRATQSFIYFNFIFFRFWSVVPIGVRSAHPKSFEYIQNI